MTGDLTKTAFVEGWHCPNRLWWHVHEPDAPERAPTAGDLLRMDQGRQVNELARTYVPGGTLVPRAPDVGQRLERTADAIAAGAPVIYHAAFRADGVFVEADILVREGDGFALVEVKSSTGVKDDHLPDLAIQVYVARAAGVPVTRAELMHLNGRCRYPDLADLFLREDVTARVEALLPEIPARVAEYRRILGGPSPNLSFGPQCFDQRDCPFTQRCWPEVTREHVLSLARVQLSEIHAWMERGIDAIRDLPLDAPLPAVAKRQVRAVTEGTLIVEQGLADALAGFELPLAFLDFETVQPAIPLWNGCRPWQQLPVQFSCHLVPDDGAIRHREWLTEGSDDPREPLARALLDACADARSVVSYWATFERDRITELAEALPGLAPDLLDINRRMRDLHPVVRDHVYHPDFIGKFGLKAVVGALLPPLAYDDLEISEGSAASALLARYLFEPAGFTDPERAALRRDLLAYCERDTFVMVALLGRLYQLGRRAAREDHPIA